MEGATTIQSLMLQLSDSLESSGAVGYSCFVAVSLVWVLLTLPTTPLEIVAAHVYGFPVGAMTGVVGKTVNWNPTKRG